MTESRESHGLVPKLQLEELQALLHAAFPDRAEDMPGRVAEVADGFVRLTLDPRPHMRRPGGIIAGPTLMALADHAAYAVILAHVGPLLMSVTHTLTISFLRACRYEPVHADTTLLKLGRRLATADVRMWQGDGRRIVAQATVGYALP